MVVAYFFSPSNMEALLSLSSFSPLGMLSAAAPSETFKLELSGIVAFVALILYFVGVIPWLTVLIAIISIVFFIYTLYEMWMNQPALSYGRGVGKPLGCGAGEEENASLCYKKCEKGYAGRGPVCWQECPKGFTDSGAYCKAPEKGKSKPNYLISDPFSKKDCGKVKGANCKMIALGPLYHRTKCGEGYHQDGSNTCIGCPKGQFQYLGKCYQSCPKGTKQVGTTCTRLTKGRGAGKPIHGCPDGHEKSGLLCYPKCRKGYTGKGPVCWRK